LTLNSGQAPTLSYGLNAAHSAFAGSSALVAGANDFIFRSESTYASEYIAVANTAATNWSATFTLYEVTECAYIGGSLWCDQSYERCVSLDNDENFGGFRFLPSLMEKDIWWGRVPA
jgi:hypothetical protein